MEQEDLILRMLHETQILHTRKAEHMVDVQLACDNKDFASYDVDKFKDKLSMQQLVYFYTVVIVNWLCGIKQFDNQSWGWYTKEDGTVEELPYLFKPLDKRKIDEYKYNGLTLTPDNMVIVLNDDLYRLTLQAIVESVNDWLNEKGTLLFATYPLQGAELCEHLVHGICTANRILKEESTDVTDNRDTVGDFQGDIIREAKAS